MCDRFPKFKSTTIGPGKYNVGAFALDSLKHKGYTAAFASGDWFKKKKIEEIPGPGTYRNPKTIVNDLMKKPGGKKGAFGSEEIWFPIHSI